jgi:hypothetical protein
MRHRAAVFLWAAIVVGCRGAPPPAVVLSAAEIDAPTGVDSGEPFLSATDDGVLMSWIDRGPSGVRDVRFARYAGSGWSEPRVVTEGERLLVNVSDFPSIVEAPDGALWTHWLERNVDRPGYGIRVARSEDGGGTWSAPWTPHQDATSADHGFVSTIPVDGGMGILWLDARAFEAGVGDTPPTRETALYSRVAGPDGPLGEESPVDPRVCDCCQTDAALTSDGPILVYRDRSPEEIRDIRVARLEEGAWRQGDLVHEDGWETGACPINGPAVDARGASVVVAWFTAANGESRVNAAFSDDGGRSFEDPVRVDDGTPAGRVDVTLLDDGTALVAWVERTGGDGTEVRLRRVGAGGRRLESVSASAPFSQRVMGFPRLARADDGAIIVAWTDGTEIVPRVRVTRIAVEES